ncbi:SLBB domain-containing protein [Caldinitratiruptor microaerophilus]|uniref:NADH-quinone oxidoreductase subunit F n=1 Tax=Caldinitratiruptor microaerophilus TaxID=671077 RepID=A0AA35CL83_9FIRM|nr:SLBB domain-containing protein [Caldinitratiruptor microaerophilus]BDG60473.1 hypothetical protein caldi_15630 [Caldinitratiruptor microaerophilus]
MSAGVCAASPGTAGLLIDPGRSTPEGLEEYRSRGGYTGLEQVLARGAGWAAEVVARARLRGRGPLGRPVAERWRRVAAGPSAARYVIGNGAESLSISRKDRYLMANHPHRVLEGLLIAARAVGAREAYLYVRGDSPESLAGLRSALEEAARAGLVGEASVTGVQVRLQPSATGPVSGEETAVIDALEGLEGRPQIRPPDPEASGLFGQPTLVQNVETLAAVAAVFREGLDRHLALGTADEPGSALFTVTGAVRRPGVYELPLGTRLADLLRLAGADPAAVRAVLPGGLASPPLWPQELDVPLSWADLGRAGSVLGNRTVIVLGPEASLPVQFAEIMQVLAEGSCGQCQGCANGTRALAGYLAALAGLAGGTEGGAPAALPAFADPAELLAYARHQAHLLTRRAGICPYPESVGRAMLRALEVFCRVSPVR